MAQVFLVIRLQNQTNAKDNPQHKPRMAIPNRLKWEWDQLQEKAEYDDMYLIPTDDGWHTWEGCIPGPASSPYKNANFRIFIKLPDDYPFHIAQCTKKSFERILHDSQYKKTCVNIIQQVQYSYV